MIPEIGQFALIMALLLALTQATIPLIGAANGNRTWIAVAAPAGQAQFIFVAIAFCCLAYSFITNDFSVLNVATNSNSQLPVHYRLAATWGSHEGSLLLWTLMLGLWTTAVSLFSRHLPDVMVARVLSVMGIISTGFLLFILTNGFEVTSINNRNPVMVARVLSVMGIISTGFLLFMLVTSNPFVRIIPA